METRRNPKYISSTCDIVIPSIVINKNGFYGFSIGYARYWNHWISARADYQRILVPWQRCRVRCKRIWHRPINQENSLYYLPKSRSSTAVPNSMSPSSSVYETVETPSFTTTSVLPSDLSKSMISPCNKSLDFKAS